MSEVCDRAARVARTLAGHGVVTETPVGLCAGRGAGMLTSLLGVWWAGGAYVPLDPGFPGGAAGRDGPRRRPADHHLPTPRTAISPHRWPTARR